MELKDIKRVIDTHVHFNTEEITGLYTDQYIDFGKRRFGIDPREVIPIEKQVEEMRRLKIIGWLVGTDVEMGPTIGTSFFKEPVRMTELQLGFAKKYPDVFVPLGGPDPNKGRLAEEQFRDWLERGLKGLKIVGYMHLVYPNDPKLFPLLELCLEYNVPVVYHLGHSAPPNTFSKYGQPILIDDVANRYPDLTIIGAHGGFPWWDEMYSVCWKHENVYCDFADWLPRYLSPTFIKYMDGPISDKVFFGTGYPGFPFEKVIKDFLTLPIRDENKEKILYKNAMKIMKKHKMISEEYLT